MRHTREPKLNNPMRYLLSLVALAVTFPLFAADPPKGFTPLFDGKSLAGWHGWAIHAKGAAPADLAKLEPEGRAKKMEEWTADAKKHWSVQNGELVNDGNGAYLATDKIKNNPSAKYYIALSTVANSTARGQAEVEKVILKAIKQKLEAAGTIQIAPPKESSDAAKGEMKKRKMSGFYLAIAVDRFDYSGGNLRVKVKIGVFTYPGKSLLGNVDKTLTKEGVSSGDRSSEDQMLDMAAGLASEQFAQNASAFL